MKKVIKEKRKSENLNGKRNKEIEKYIISFFEKTFKKDKEKFKIKEINKIFKSYTKCSK